MGLPAIGGTAWQDEIEAIHAAHFRQALISIYDPSSGSDAAIISRRSARVQQQRTPTIATDSGQQVAKRAFLFEIELRDSDPAIEKDMLIRVHDGGRDPKLRLYGFTVTNSVNSSEAAVRNIETVTELAILPVAP